MEGGGDTRAQAAPLRKAVHLWLARVLPEGKDRNVRVIACGPRRKAFEMFRDDLAKFPSSLCLLLVDSEEPIRTASGWEHVRTRDGDSWERPSAAPEEQIHFMAVVMETWLLADGEALRGYFGEGFNDKHLPGHPDLESLDKAEVYRRLESATRGSRRGCYNKGRDLELLGRVDSRRVLARCPHASRLVDVISRGG